jgi:hypothetical protein
MIPRFKIEMPQRRRAAKKIEHSVAKVSSLKILVVLVVLVAITSAVACGRAAELDQTCVVHVAVTSSSTRSRRSGRKGGGTQIAGAAQEEAGHPSPGPSHDVAARSKEEVIINAAREGAFEAVIEFFLKMRLMPTAEKPLAVLAMIDAVIPIILDLLERVVPDKHLTSSTNDVPASSIGGNILAANLDQDARKKILGLIRLGRIRMECLEAVYARKWPEILPEKPRENPWDACHRLGRLARGKRRTAILECGVTFFVLMLEQLGARTLGSCEGHPTGFYIFFECSERLAEEIARVTPEPLQVSRFSVWDTPESSRQQDPVDGFICSFPHDIQGLITHDDRLRVLRATASAWEEAFGPLRALPRQIPAVPTTDGKVDGAMK